MKMSSYGMRMDPKSIERSYKRQKDTQRHRPGRRPFNMKEEIGGMPPQVKECLEPPGAGRDKEVICLSPPWFWTSGLWNCVRIHFSSGKIIPETINIPSLLSLSVSSYFFLFLIRILIDKMVESKTMLCLIKKKKCKNVSDENLVRPSMRNNRGCDNERGGAFSSFHVKSDKRMS